MIHSHVGVCSTCARRPPKIATTSVAKTGGPMMASASNLGENIQGVELRIFMQGAYRDQ